MEKKTISVCILEKVLIRENKIRILHKSYLKKIFFKQFEDFKMCFILNLHLC